MNKKNAMTKPKSEKVLINPKEGIDLPNTIGKDRESKFLGSKDLDISEISHLKSSKDMLPLVRHVTIAAKIEEEERSQRESEKLASQVQPENINATDLSKKVLLKCNIIRTKREGVPTLNRGDGHLMTMSEKSIRQIYQDVYHKPYP